jgi:hypothetical protein
VTVAQRDYSEEEAEAILRLAANSRGSGGVSRDQLRQMAAELGVGPDQLERAEQQYLASQAASEEQLAFRKHRRQEFIGHLATYCAINFGLLLMDVVPDGRLNWVLWPVLGWGIGLLAHAASFLFPGGQDHQTEFKKWQSAQRNELTEEEKLVLNDIVIGGAPGKINAIKELRERLNLSLVEAKQVADRYEAENPGIFNSTR